MFDKFIFQVMYRLIDILIDWNYLGKLLSSVQADPDATRRAAVKKRVAQYISKAEQLGKEVFRFLLFLYSFLHSFFNMY